MEKLVVVRIWRPWIQTKDCDILQAQKNHWEVYYLELCFKITFLNSSLWEFSYRWEKHDIGRPLWTLEFEVYYNSPGRKEWCLNKSNSSRKEKVKDYNVLVNNLLLHSTYIFSTFHRNLNLFRLEKWEKNTKYLPCDSLCQPCL